MPVTVVKGDTLKRIAAANNITLAQLRQLNPGLFDKAHRGGDLIRPGEVVILSSDSSPTAPSSSRNEPQDSDWQRVASKFERVFGRRPSINADVDKILREIRIREPEWVAAAREFERFFGFLPAGHADAGMILRIVRNNQPLPDPTVPPIPDIPDEEGPESIDFRSRAQALFPWLPPALLDIFADAWATTGDRELALAITRADPQYDQFFPGIKRADGSLRLSEAEYLARIDGYKLALTQFNLNPANFSGQFAQMIEGELTAGQFASRLSSAFEDIITSMPEIREFYAENFGIAMTDESIFASFLDPDLGDAIINRRISQAQIGGAGAAAGFTIDLAFTEQLRQQGLQLGTAQAFFGDAAFQVPVLTRLALRFGLDKTFDITEFAAGTILGDPAERRRQRRLFGGESSSFSERLGTVRTEESLAISGLSPR